MRAKGVFKLMLATSIVTCCASAAMADAVDTEFVGTVYSFRGNGWNQADIGGSVTLDLQYDDSALTQSYNNGVLSFSAPVSSASLLDGVLGSINLEPNGAGRGSLVEKFDLVNNTQSFSAKTTGKAPDRHFTGSVFSVSFLVDNISSSFEVIRSAFVDGKPDRADSGAVLFSNVTSTSGVSAPEIDPASAAGAFALLFGSLAILRSRKTAKPRAK